MNLLDSLLDAIVRLDGDALVMHVGEKPYVVTTSEAANQFRGPLAWGQVELSTRVLTTDAVSGMLGQILPLDQRSALDDFGAIEYDVTATNHADEKFTIVAARGGDDIWVEMRRHPRFEAQPAVAAPSITQEPAVVDATPAVHPGEPAAVASAAPAQEQEAMANQNPLETEAVGEEVALDDFAVQAAPDADVEESIELPAVFELPTAISGVDPAVIDLPAVDLPDLTSGIDLLDSGEPVATFELPSLTETPALAEQSAFEGELEHELATQAFSLERDIDSGILSQDWAEDLMTEGELGELLRATAAAAIAGETLGRQGLDEDDRQSLAAAATASAVSDFEVMAEHIDLTALEESSDAEIPLEVVVSARAAVAPEEVELPIEVDVPAGNADEGHHVSRETQELPALVAYQMERDRDAGQPAAPATAELEPVIAAVAPAAEPPAQEPAPATRIDGPIPIERVDGPSHGPAAEEPEIIQPAAAASHDEEEQIEERPPLRPAAVVLPLTRQTKIEAAPDNRAAAASTLQRLLRLASARGAATVYVVANAVPLVRVDGEFATLEGEPAISGAVVERLLAEVAPGGRGQNPPSAEWLIDVAEIGRVRCLMFRDHRGAGLIFRMVPQRSISADQLGLSAEVQALCNEADGLVLVTGGRGSGKSTLLTSFVDLINRTRSDHIITTESQIEFVHESKRSFISQREVRGEDALAAAVRAACREEADVLIIEDIRTHELASLALEAAESGRLVFGSVPGLSTASAVERLIDLFPAERREKAQATLAGVLRGIVSQVLLRKLRGGRVAAREVLLNTPAVASLILEGKTFQLPGAIENGRRAGMSTFADSLAALVREGTVHPAHAYRKAPNREQFLAALRRDGIDTSVAERLG